MRRNYRRSRATFGDRDTLVRHRRTVRVVRVTYHCPYCGAVTGIERDGYLADRCVTKEPLEGWEYVATTDDFEEADGIEFVCLGDAGPAGDGKRDDGDSDEVGGGEGDGCGRTFYLSFVRFEGGREVDPEVPPEDYDDGPRFDFLR